MIMNIIRVLAVGAIAFSLSIASARAADIVDTAIAAGNFKTLVKALEAADLVTTLKGKGPFTVFAPTDDAFAKLPAGKLDELLMPANKKELVSILKYHVVSGKVMSTSLMGKKMSEKSVEGSALTIDGMSGVKVDAGMVTKADIEASNGVIHVIDTVLIPKK
jgi:uncharacterized surface protein with fasciclin (FAS1) repeats